MFNNKNTLVTEGKRNFAKEYIENSDEVQNITGVLLNNNIKGSRAIIRYTKTKGSYPFVIPFLKKVIDQEVTKGISLKNKKITRFFLITLEKSLDFVLKSFKHMYNHKIFIPKISSMCL